MWGSISIQKMPKYFTLKVKNLFVWKDPFLRGPKISKKTCSIPRESYQKQKKSSIAWTAIVFSQWSMEISKLWGYMTGTENKAITAHLVPWALCLTIWGIGVISLSQKVSIRHQRKISSTISKKLSNTLSKFCAKTSKFGRIQKKKQLKTKFLRINYWPLTRVLSKKWIQCHKVIALVNVMNKLEIWTKWLFPCPKLEKEGQSKDQCRSLIFSLKTSKRTLMKKNAKFFPISSLAA